MNMESVIDRKLSQRDYRVLGQAIANGYAACNKVMRGAQALSMFAPGIEHRSYLNPIFVQHALTVAANTEPDWYYAIEPNNAGNCLHVRLFINTTCAITAHFLGRTNSRTAARPAVNRAILASMNGDLFDNQQAEPESATHLYCHLLHAGDTKPILAVLAIPSTNQLGYYGSSVKITIPESEATPVERIADEMSISLRKDKDAKEAG